MNFYYGNSLEEVDINDENIVFSDELYNYICQFDVQIPFDMSVWNIVDPYGDTEIPISSISEVIGICNFIINSSILDNYEDPFEGQSMLEELHQFAEEAQKRKVGLICIGD